MSKIREMKTAQNLSSNPRPFLNGTFCRIVEHLEEVHNILYMSPDQINGDSCEFTENQWLEMCSDSCHENWPTPIAGDFYDREEYDRFTSCGEA